MARFGVKEVMDVTLYDLVTGKPALFLDTLKMSNMETTTEKVYATGGQGNGRLCGWEFGRIVNFMIQDALLHPTGIALKTGKAIEKGMKKIHRREVVAGVDKTDNTELTLSKTPIAGTITIYKTADGVEHGEEIPAGQTTVAGNKITIPEATLVAGTPVIVYFQYETVEQAETLKISSRDYAGFYKLVGDTIWLNQKTGKNEKVQIVAQKVKLISDFTLNMQPDGEPSVFDFNLEVYETEGSDDMVEMIRYTE